MTAEQKIQKAKIQLLLNHPFYATLALGVKYESCSEIETGDIDGKTMRFNPAWIDTLPMSKVVGFLAHEVSHVALLHHTRRGNREPENWNMACDYAINLLLKESNFDLPDGGLLDQQYKGMAAEEIYRKLPAKPPQNKSGTNNGNGSGKSNNDPGKCGGVRDTPAKTESEKNQIEAETKQLVAQAINSAKMQGKLPAHLARVLAEAMEPIVNWKDVLNTFLTEVSRSDYTFSQPSKRYLSQGLYLPSLRSIEKGKFIFIVDTSGSVWAQAKLLESIFSEMQSILSEISETITVYYVDTKIHGEPIEYESDETLNLNPVGGGGTDFKPAFDHIEKNGIEAAAIVYFTDGYCNSFPKDPGTPTLWATYDNKNFTPPFGGVIRIN
jgi:predicted metal-dependent peptidase